MLTVRTHKTKIDLTPLGTLSLLCNTFDIRSISCALPFQWKPRFSSFSTVLYSSLSLSLTHLFVQFYYVRGLFTISYFSLIWTTIWYWLRLAHAHLLRCPALTQQDAASVFRTQALTYTFTLALAHSMAATVPLLWSNAIIFGCNSSLWSQLRCVT